MPDESTDQETNKQRAPFWPAVLLATVEGAALAGLVDVSLRLLVPHFTGTGLRNLNPYAVWLSPAANALVLFPVLAMVALAARLTSRSGRSGAWLRLTSYTYAAAQGTLLIGRFHWEAAIVLALGVGVATMRLTEMALGRRIVRGLAIASVVAATGWAILIPVTRRVRYANDVGSLAAAPAGAPNVLLLILDTVGADEMSHYGYGRRTTPVFDSLARHGVTFERAISSAPWTLPSHASMLTGRRAEELSARFVRPLDRSAPLVEESFASAGYVTGGFVANLEYTSRASGLARGFHWYSDFVPSLPAAVEATALGRRVARRVGGWRGRPVQPGRKMAAQVNREFLDWERRTGDRPWFAFLNYYDAHDPYIPPRAEERRFLGAGEQRVHDITNLRASDTAAVHSARALHDAAIFSLDRAIGQLLAELQGRGELENTVVVVTSDHGEEFGGHGLLGHGNSVFYASIHVPLLVLNPRRVPANLRFDAPVGTRNLAATLLDLAGLSTSGYDGLSLAWTWEGGAQSRAQTPVISWVEHNRNQPPEYPASRSELFSVITDSAQVIFGADTLVFDLSTIEVDLQGQRGKPAFADDIFAALRALRSPR